jgi:hypothetical protein
MAFGKPLFNDGELSEVLRRHIATLDSLVERRYQGAHETLSDEQIAVGIADEAAFKPLSVDFDNPQKDAVAQRVKVLDYNRPIEVDGVRATYRFNFVGDAGLFYLQPNSFGSQLPRAEVQGSSIMIAFDGSNSSEPEGVKRELERQRDLLKEYLSNQEKQIVQHNQELVQHVRTLVEARRRSLEGLKKLQEAL